MSTFIRPFLTIVAAIGLTVMILTQTLPVAPPAGVTFVTFA